MGREKLGLTHGLDPPTLLDGLADGEVQCSWRSGCVGGEVESVGWFEVGAAYRVTAINRQGGVGVGGVAALLPNTC